MKAKIAVVVVAVATLAVPPVAEAVTLGQACRSVKGAVRVHYWRIAEGNEVNAGCDRRPHGEWSCVWFVEVPYEGQLAEGTAKVDSHGRVVLSRPNYGF